jgi:hypothetical protein
MPPAMPAITSHILIMNAVPRPAYSKPRRFLQMCKENEQAAAV